ncbi:hypothetical protein CCP4SC76_6240020 [Gammaproteobacteria bacterium]
MKFSKAEKKRSKLRLALTGPSGSGKTYSSLLIAAGMGGRVAVIDTERGSASLYAGLTDFDTLELGSPFTPERFIAAIRTAETEGYDILILDSISHEWSGTGGCLDLLDDLAKAKYKGNTWSAWSEVTPRHRAFLDAILQSRMHIIATMRSKTETAQSQEGGKVKVTKLGMKSEQREGAEYEFTTILDLSHEGHLATQSKDRTGLFANRDPFVIDIETGKALMDWLNSGAAEAPLISVAQHRLLEFEINQRGVDRQKVKAWCAAAFGIAKFTELTTGQFERVLRRVTATSNAHQD